MTDALTKAERLLREKCERARLMGQRCNPQPPFLLCECCAAADALAAERVRRGEPVAYLIEPYDGTAPSVSMFGGVYPDKARAIPLYAAPPLPPVVGDYIKEIERITVNKSRAILNAPPPLPPATGEGLMKLIGQPPEGSHPDEWLPRAATWHDERLHWQREVERLREQVGALTQVNDKLSDDLVSLCERTGTPYPWVKDGTPSARPTPEPSEAMARVFESLPSRTTPHGTWRVCPTCSGDGKFVEFDKGCAARWAHPLLNAPSATRPARAGEPSEAMVEAGVKALRDADEKGEAVSLHGRVRVVVAAALAAQEGE